MAAKKAGQSSKKKQPHGIQSATVALSILKTLIESDRPLYLREVAAGVDMPNSNVYRYLVSFGQAGLISQDPATGRYDLGPLAIQLGLSALRRVDAVEIAIETLTRLVQAAKTDGHITVWGSAGPTVLRWKGGPAEVAVRVAEGLVLPILSSATGRLWAAFLPREQFADLLDTQVADVAKTTNVGGTKLLEQFERQLDEIRRTGISYSPGERRSGISALCAPVFDRDGNIVLSITLLGVSSGFDSHLEGSPTTNLRLAVEEISRRLGGGPLVLQRYPWSAQKRQSKQREKATSKP